MIDNEIGEYIEGVNEPEETRIEDDLISHPSHYTFGEVECIDAIESALSPAEYRGYLKGCMFKYLWRVEHKDTPESNLGKHQYYAQKLLQHYEEYEDKVDDREGALITFLREADSDIVVTLQNSVRHDGLIWVRLMDAASDKTENVCLIPPLNDARLNRILNDLLAKIEDANHDEKKETEDDE